MMSTTNDDNQSNEMIPRHGRPALAFAGWKAILECLDLCESQVQEVEYCACAPETVRCRAAERDETGNCCSRVNQHVEFQDNLVTYPCLGRQGGSKLEKTLHPQGYEKSACRVLFGCVSIVMRYCYGTPLWGVNFPFMH